MGFPSAGPLNSLVLIKNDPSSASNVVYLHRNQSLNGPSPDLTQKPKSAAREPSAAKAATKATPSPPSDGGEGGERRRVCFGLPLSSVFSPLLRRGERKKKPCAKIFVLATFRAIAVQRIQRKTADPDGEWRPDFAPLESPLRSSLCARCVLLRQFNFGVQI